MKTLTFIVICIALGACTTKKTESTAVLDSLKTDTTVLADVPAPVTLAFSPVVGYSVKNTVSLIDSVNFILLENQDAIDSRFSVDKTVPEASKPDFIINYVFAVVCTPSLQQTTIVVDKVEVGSDINVYVTIRRGEVQKSTSKPAQIFAIEKRDGPNAIQFFVNGQKSIALLVI